MLQQLVEMKREVVLCDSVYDALGGILKALFVQRLPFVDLINRSSRKSLHEGTSASDVFDQVSSLLEMGKWIDGQPLHSETYTGVRRLRIANPLEGMTELASRMKLGTLEPAAALLKTFLLLRVRYQETAKLEARKDDEPALDTLYLVGDAFTERYPVRATLETKGEMVLLTLSGEPQRVPTGGWDRLGYIRARDACLLLRPLKEALESPRRPLVIPRETRAMRGEGTLVRVRVPASASTPIDTVRKRITAIHWLEALKELKNLTRPDQDPPLPAPGPLGEHASYEMRTGGYVVGAQGRQIEEVFPLRVLANAAPKEAIQPRDAAGRIAVTMEAIGGAREIGANSYYYQLGERGLLVDVGYDATRDGWLGLPALERINRLDAVILTHAHIDHIGSLPLLLDAFPNVPVYCTKATLDVLFPMLHDSATVAGYRYKDTGEMPALTRGMVNTLSPTRFRPLGYGVETQIREIPGLTLKFHDAGHIIGSANARLGFAGVEILHTGDISVEDQHLLRGMQVVDQRAHHVVMEGTYSGEPEFGRAQRHKAIIEFEEALAERLDAGGSVLVPAFSLGRAQELVGMLVDWRKRTGRSFPLYTVGMVNTLNDISAQLPEFLPGLQGQPFAETEEFDVGEQRNKSFEERCDSYARKFLDVSQAHPCVIIASHGMMMEKTGSYFIGRAILTGEDKRHAIFLCGYMDPRTPGYRLHHQGCDPIIHYGIGDTIERKIPEERIRFFRLTAHASYEELVEVGTQIALKTVTLIHGEAKGLDYLRDDLLRELRAKGREIQVRAPALGERILLDHVPPPPDWELEPAVPRSAERRGPDFLEQNGLYLRGMTWHGKGKSALLPIGQEAVMLALEADRVSPTRIIKVEARQSEPGKPLCLYDRERKQGDLSRLPWSTPGTATWMVTAQDSDGRHISSELCFDCAAEIRVLSPSLDATRPVLDLEVGGRHTPRVRELRVGDNPTLLRITQQSWDPVTRRVQLQLRAPREVRLLERVEIDLDWNGWVQKSFPLGTLTLEPEVDVAVAPARVGVRTSLQVKSQPPARAARMDGRAERLEGDRVSFMPRQPGPALLELQYGRDDRKWEWRQAGLIEVLPSASVDLPRVTSIARDLDVVIRDIEPTLHGVALELHVDDELLARWTAGAGPHRCSGPLSTLGEVEVQLVAPAKGLVLWRGMVHVRAALELDRDKSFPVASVDGRLEATLVWPGISAGSQAMVEKAFQAEGFTGLRWEGDTLYLRGTSDTQGTREVVLVDGASHHRVKLVTLPSQKLRLQPPSPSGPGASLIVSTMEGPLNSGLEDVDAGPLRVVVERVSPFMDRLSAKVEGASIQLLHPGRYLVALTAWDKRISELETEVSPPAPLPSIPQVQPSESEGASAAVASDHIEQLPPGALTLALRPVGGAFRVLQHTADQLDAAAWEFVRSRIGQKELIMVVTAGLELPADAGRLLRRLRKERPEIHVAHVSYPAPRGELARDLDQTRRLLEYVACVIPAGATVDRFDAYACPQCAARMQLQTDDQSLWLHCQSCGFEDRGVALTLDRLRREKVQVLFTDYRIARYLRSESGARYAGAFGRTVRCGQCEKPLPAFQRPGPWDGALLRRLVSAMSGAWRPDDEAGSIRRAARRAAQQPGKAQPGEFSRLERALRHLLDGGVFVQGQPMSDLRYLEEGVSQCCRRPLTWSSQRISYAFLDLKSLLLQPSALHPGLPNGAEGVRQLLALAEEDRAMHVMPPRPTAPRRPLAPRRPTGKPDRLR